MNIQIIRFKESEQGTQGLLLINDCLFCYTLEMPWHNNEPFISCIPSGKYKCIPHKFKGRTKCFKLLNVPNRTNILIHPGNVAGDITKGYQSDVRGCIVIGRKWGKLDNQIAVLQSRWMMKQLVQETRWNEFELTIKVTDDLSHQKDWIFRQDV